MVVGREGLIAAAVTAAETRGVVLAGPHGSGRTALLEACAARVTGDVAIVDDLHLLDPVEAGELRERVVAGDVRLLATVLAGATYAEPVVLLWRDDGIIRLDIPPLTDDAVAELASEWADGSVEGVAVQRLLELSGGLPGDLLDILDALATHGWFDTQHGVVRMRPWLPDAPSLRRRIAGVADLSPAARRAVELAAMARAVAVPVLASLSSHAGLAEARAAGFLAVDFDGRVHRASPPSALAGELVRMTLDADTRRAHRRSLAAALTAAPRSELDADGQRLVAEAYVDDGLHSAEQIELARAVVADGLRDGRSDVVELAAAVWHATDASEDGLALTLAFDHAGRAAEQASVAEEVAHRAADDHVLGVATDRLASALVRQGRDDEAVAVLRGALARLVDPSARARLTIALANRHLHRGELTAAAEMAEPLLTLGVPVPEAALVAAVAHAAAGRCGRALELAAMGDDMLSAAEAGELVGALLPVARALALTEAGRLDEAEAAVVGAYTQAVAAGDRPRQGWSALALGRIELARGRAQRALRYFRDSTAGFGDMGEIGYVAWALAGRAAAHALIGDQDAAEDAASRRDALPHERLGLFESESQRLLALVEWCGGNVDTAVDRLTKAVAGAGEQLVAKAACLHDLVRLGVSEHAADLQSLANSRRLIYGSVDQASRVRGRGDDRVDLLAAHAAALVAGDSSALVGVAGRRAEREAWLDAAAAYVEAADHTPDRRDQAFARRRAWATLSRCEGATRPGLDSLVRPDLTRRQLDVAVLAAAGLSRPAIAAQLFLSDRTVDRHLDGAFAALGVRQQAQLSAALDDLRIAPVAPKAPEGQWPLVGRTEEANMIRRAVADPAVRGVLLSGPVGCGKTRLATDMQSELADRGWTAITIRGTAPSETTRAALADALAAERVALVVDDAGFLGEEAIASLTTALSSLHGFAFITTSEEQPAAKLDRTDLLRIAVAPLPPDGVRAVLAAALHGPVLGTTVAAFERASAGNPLLLRELLHGAQSSGRLVSRDGVWALVGPLVPSPGLRELVRNHLGTLEAAARRALDLLAVTGSLPRSLAERLITSEELRLVVDAGLAEQVGTGVHLSHESYETEILAQLPLDRRSAILDTVLDAGSDVDALRLARWSLHAGRVPSAALLVDAAAQALWLSDAATAVDLATQAGEEGLLLAAVARSVLGDLDVADKELADAGGELADRLRSDIARWRWGASDALSAAARYETAAAAAEQEMAELDHDWTTWHRAQVLTSQWAMSLVAAGRLDDAEAVLQARRPGMHHRGPPVHPSPEEGVLALERGHVATAMLLFRDALEHPAAQPGTSMARILHTGLALAAAWAGDAATARTELTVAGGDDARVAAWITAAEGDRPAAGAQLAAAADDAPPGIGVVLVHDAVRLGAFGEARRLAELAGRVEGPLAAARRAYAEALVAHAPDAVLAAAEEFAACGTDLLAGETARLAASWFEEAGDRRAAKRAAAAANGWLSLCTGVVAATVSMRPAALTMRQLDIARLAAQGLSSRDIAARLGLSVRTIDNQLQRVYERLGIRGRPDLAPALANLG